MDRGRRIPLHDHSGFNQGGRIDATTIVQVIEGSGSSDLTFGEPVAVGTALSAGASENAASADHVHTNAYLGTVLTYGTAQSGYVLTAQSAGSATWAAAGGGAGSVVWYDEGVAVGTASVVNLVGAGVSGTVTSGTAVITITGGTVDPSIIVRDEGTLAGTATVLNFTGVGGTASFAGGTATIDIPGLIVYDEGVLAGTVTKLNVVGSSGTVAVSSGTATLTLSSSGGGSVYGTGSYFIHPLDRTTVTGLSAYGDDFAGTALDAKWTRHNQTSGMETYAVGPRASILRVDHGATNAAEYIYQTAPNGTNETWEASFSFWQKTSTNQMFGILMLNSSGNGVAVMLYDNSAGLYLANVASHVYSTALASDTGFLVGNHAYRAGQRIWLKLRKASGVYYGSYSFDGEEYSAEISGTPSAFTPARIGIGRFLGTQANSRVHWHWFDRTAAS